MEPRKKVKKKEEKQEIALYVVEVTFPNIMIICYFTL